jgi:pimeloyl-ACP methyl ester carboxylesterase
VKRTRTGGFSAAGSTGFVRTRDGERISFFQAEGPADHAIVVAHGFTGSWRQPRVLNVIAELSQFGTVFALDFRGHGASSGRCTVGNAEVLDVDALVTHAYDQGFSAVSTVGFSMGGGIVLRHAALHENTPSHVASVVSVSAPAFWYYRGTRVMRLVHHLVMRPHGRALMRARGIRLDSRPWPDPPPMSPVQAVAALQHTPTLIVHGDQDRYFPVEHADALIAAGLDVDGLRIEGFGHAESAISAATLHEIGAWIDARRAR